MRKTLLLLGAIMLATGCDQLITDTGGKASPDKITSETKTIEEEAEALKEQGYLTFAMKEGDTTYLMQQYFMVFLKAGDSRSQDSTEAAKLQEQHLAHLTRMAEEGYTSLTGPFGSDGEIRGIVVYNTPTREEADSLANLDPAVQAGRLTVEVHPWWTLKGGKLK